MKRTTRIKIIGLAGAATAIFLMVMLVEQGYVNHSDSNYADCKRLRQDLYYFEAYRDNRPAYKAVKNILKVEKASRGCN